MPIGSWNEYVGEKIVFFGKRLDGQILTAELSPANESWREFFEYFTPTNVPPNIYKWLLELYVYQGILSEHLKDSLSKEV